MVKLGSLKKIILITCVILIVLLVFLGGTVFYYYSHPSALKAFIEKRISKSTGTSVTIKKISYSLKPVMIHAQGIQLKPGKDLKGFHLDLPDFTAHISFKGPFGHKSLIIEKLKVDRLSLYISHKLDVTEIDSSPAGSSFTGRVIKKVIALFLFRDIEFQGVEIINSLITAQLRDQTIRLNRIYASLTPDHRVEISLNARIKWPHKKISIAAPHIFINTDRVISFASPEIKARLTIKNAALKSPDVSVKGMALTAGLKYNHNHRKLSFDRADFHFQGVTLNQKSKKQSTPLNVYIKTNGIFDLKDRRLKAQYFHLTIRDLLQLKGRLDAHLGTQRRVGVEILIDEIGTSRPAPETRPKATRFNNLRVFFKHDGERVTVGLNGQQVGLFESALALNLLPSGWQFSGHDSIEIKARQKDNRYWSFSMIVDFQSMNFQNPDGTCMGEKVSAHVKIDGRINLATSCINANTSIELERGEVLYDRFYLDLGKNALTTSCKAIYNIANKDLQLSGLKLGVRDIIALEAHGMIHHKAEDNRIRLCLKIPETPVKPAFKHFVLEPFHTEIPFLNGLTIGGNLSVNLELAGNRKDLQVLGRCIWNKGEFSMKGKGLFCQGIELDLPVWYHYSVTSNESRITSPKQNLSLVTNHSSLKGNPVKGKVYIRSMTIPFLPEQSLTLNLNAGPNMLSVQSPTTLKVPGGSVELGPVVGKDIFSSRASIETSLSIDAVETKPVLEKILPQPVNGTIDGYLNPIHFKSGTLKTTGVITVKAFDGEIVLSDIWTSGLFTPAPVYRLSALLTYLNLEKITMGTAFGKIEGVLEGHINDLEIVYGQPQKFELLLETVRVEGVSQKISVRAVDNIARIGGGSSPFMGLAGGFTSFFKEFSYNKIGVIASLKNDVFRINGTIKRGGKEYLVERGRFSGVNIVNQNPDNRIRFKDMVKRIQRVTSSKKGPVIK